MKLTDDRHCLLINRGQGCHNASLFHPPLAVSCHTIGRRLHYSKSAGAVETIGINSEEAPNAVSVRISSVQVCNDGWESLWRNLSVSANQAVCRRYNKNDKRRIREKSASFVVTENVLYHKGYKGKIQRVVKHSEVHDLVHQMHSSVIGGCHFGQNATHQKISERFWWPMMTEDVRHVVKSCER